MTSTEFTIGLDGSRNSSKVLKPPGGGSSDIFGLGAGQYSSNERQKNKEAASSNTQSRLFGSSENGTSTPTKKHTSSNIFAASEPFQSKSSKKPYVRRNPITGEEYGTYPEYDKKENGEKDKNENGDEKNADDEQDNSVEQNGGTTEVEKKTDMPPAKPIATSIRVRNPPGGKSSGIF